ncbi:MAG: Holliday junction resolvase RuvX [Phycisphaerales bacterium]|nr:Holliday junction resolvase RuvX [Phycisphaerales bacterium]
MRIFAIDLGDQRTGLALGDRITNIASPAGLIEVPIDRESGLSLIQEIHRQYLDQTGGSNTEMVLGLPLNMDETEGPRAKLVRAFAIRLANHCQCPIILVDERRTSIAADLRMSQSGLTHKQKKMRRDAIAAAAIAQMYLDDPNVAIDTITPMNESSNS